MSANHTSKGSAPVSVRDFGAVGDGVVDDTRAIQAALASAAPHVVVPSGIYILRGALMPTAGQRLEINGMLRVADAVIQRLVDDVAIGDSSAVVADGSCFRPGDWVVLHDEQLPIQGGGRKVRRQGAGSARVVEVEGNVLKLDQQSARTYRRQHNAVIATMHAAIIIEHPAVHICGSGVIDCNRANQLNTAPAGLDREVGEEHRVGCGIRVHGDRQPLPDIVIEGVTVRDAVLHNITLRGAVNSVVRNVRAIGAHDKNIALARCRDCSLIGNFAAYSVYEDGIVFHQTPDPALSNHRVRIEGNTCVGNPRNGIHIGKNMQHIELVGNLCLNNGVNITLNGDHCSSTNDVAIGANDAVFPLHLERPNFQVGGNDIRIEGLNAQGTPSFGIGIAGADVEVRNSSVALAECGESWASGIGICVTNGAAFGYSPDVNPKRVTINGITITGSKKEFLIDPDVVDLSIGK